MSRSEYATWLLLVASLTGYAITTGATWALAAPAALLVLVTREYVHRR